MHPAESVPGMQKSVSLPYATVLARCPTLSKPTLREKLGVEVRRYRITETFVPRVGIEPTTRGFSVRCSTN
jgi:hypothetical protein